MVAQSLQQSVEYGVLGVLGFLSVVMVWAVVERWLFYRQVRLEEYAKRQALEIDLTSRLSLIATIGSNAPYVGLLGTVLGIMITFYNMGQSGNIDSASIMQGLALALKATAAGLLVAIPSVVFYNLLVRKSEVLLARWDMLHDS